MTLETHDTRRTNPIDVAQGEAWASKAARTNAVAAPRSPKGLWLHAQLAGLNHLSTAMTYPRGRTVQVEGETPETVSVVRAGLVKEYDTLLDGRRHILGFRGPREVLNLELIGERAAERAGEACRHTIDAATDVVLLSYPLQAVRRLVRHDEDSRSALSSDLAARLSDLERKALALGCLPALARVGQFLGDLARREIGDSTYEAVTIPVCRQDIADYLGLTLETVCRSIGHLKADGIIVLEGCHSFRVLRPHALEDLVYGT